VEGIWDIRKSGLEKAKQALGKKGNKNPRIRSALAALKKAQLDLSRTTIVAPSQGGITNLQIDAGHYASAGTPLMTFIEVDNIWIQANLRENNIANIEPGDSVDIVLDVAPGRVFSGTVSSIGFAVDSSITGSVGDLAKVEGKSGWLREAQRFPVIITFDDNSARGFRRFGGQADVLVYTSNNWIINPLGWLWIRLLSWFSYVY
jgi:multidrug resistance efflux pump